MGNVILIFLLDKKIESHGFLGENFERLLNHNDVIHIELYHLYSNVKPNISCSTCEGRKITTQDTSDSLSIFCHGILVRLPFQINPVIVCYHNIYYSRDTKM
jgi:hypothetical protein